MTVVVIGPKEEAQIAEMLAHARANYTPWTELYKSIIVTDKHDINLADREKVPMPPRPENRHIMLGTAEAAISFEEQPAGICKHLSVAVPHSRPGKLPHPAVVEMIAKAFGFSGLPIKNGTVWIEEYEPGRSAVNLVEVVEPYEASRTAELARLVNPSK